MTDVLKIIFALFLYGIFAPMLGVVLATRRQAQRVLFGVMVFMPSLKPGWITLMIDSIEKYRGHAKGFEISLIEVVALALIIAVVRTPRAPGVPSRNGLPPGLLVYLAWVAVCLGSLVNAIEPSYVWMAFARFAKGALMFAAAALCLRDDKDLRAGLIGLASSLALQAAVSLKMRYVDGFFQIRGWFEHQNPMSMWAYMSSIVVFAAAVHREVKGRLLLLMLGAVGGAGLCVLLSVSRAALAAYAIGSAVVLCMAWVRGPGRRTTALSIMGVCGAVLAMLFAMDSLNDRLHEVNHGKNSEAEDLRDVLNRQSKMMRDDNPSLGIGWNNFGLANSRPRGVKYSGVLEDWDASRGFNIYDENYWANPLTESLYWLLMAENGWVGWAFFLLFEAVTLWCALRAWLHGGSSLRGYVAFGLLVVLLICYQHALVERILTQTKNLSHWLILAGMASGMEMNRRAEARATRLLRK